MFFRFPEWQASLNQFILIKKISRSQFCLACEAEPIHMYCFSGVVVVVVVVGGGVNYFVFRSISQKL